MRFDTRFIEHMIDSACNQFAGLSVSEFNHSYVRVSLTHAVVAQMLREGINDEIDRRYLKCSVTYGDGQYSIVIMSMSKGDAE